MALPAGKLPADLLRDFLGSIPSDPSVVVGPGIGRDAAAVRVGDRVLVLKSDPITFATSDAGWYLVNVNANDIACMGAEPRWMLVTALLPENDTTPELVSEIFDGLTGAAREIGCLLVGGHTEITVGLDRPILVGCMIGEGDESGIVDPTTAKPGDAVLLIGGIAVEGTALLASEFEAALVPRVDPAILERGRQFLRDPGISVVSSARRVRRAAGQGLRALHDPTEGGLATGLHELSEATGCGVLVRYDAIHVYPETTVLCDALGVDPLGLIASGALLAVEAFWDLSESEQQELLGWIRTTLRPIRRRPRGGSFLSAYYLKHVFADSPNGFYVTNGQFKGAMQQAGFEGIDAGNGINLNYKVSIDAQAAADA